MKRAKFLQAGVAIVGAAWLSRHLPWRSEVMAAAKNEFEIQKTEEE